MVEIHEVDPDTSEAEDCLIGRATLPLADRKIESSANWPLIRGLECSGTLTVHVKIPNAEDTPDTSTPKTKRAAASTSQPSSVGPKSRAWTPQM